ncbi:MAG: glycosyltransferase family 9 protein [Bdellovibrionales bacterium]|nr:glycosyltransferase family 9 protein [Bdellovibrionales bacterium]
MPNSSLRVLVRLSALGDIVLCSALAERLQRDFPQDRLIFVTRAEFTDFVAQRFPADIEARAASSLRLGALGWLLNGWHAAGQLLRPEQPVTIYDLHGVSKSLLWCLGFKLRSWRKRVSCALHISRKRGLMRLFSVWTGRDLLGPRWIYREHLALASSTVNDHPHLRAERRRPPSSGLHVLAAPDARHWKKKWPAWHWQALLTRLLEANAQNTVTLVGGPQALPRDLIDELQERYGTRLTDLSGRTPLAQLPDIAADHDVTVCGNSAWLHISEAVGTPVITMAGPIVPGFGFSPWRPESQELGVEINCRPCTRHGGGICRRVNEEFHLCMRKVTSDDAWQALQKLLTKRSARMS